MGMSLAKQEALLQECVINDSSDVGASPRDPNVTDSAASRNRVTLVGRPYRLYAETNKDKTPLKILSGIPETI